MNEKDIAEQAYNNGYNQALKDHKLNTYRTSWKAKFLEAKKEIERLTDTLNQYINGELINADTMGKIISLEKQVDELKESANGYLLTTLYKKQADDHKRAISVQRTHYEKKLKQAVKDKAKEILDDLRNIFIEQSSYGSDANQHIGYYDYEVKMGLVVEQIEEYAKEKYGIEYGVEVE